MLNINIGDTIVCKDGTIYTACAKEDIPDGLANRHVHKFTFVGIRKQHGYTSWNGWYVDGSVTLTGEDGLDIKQVIPKEQPMQKEFNTKGFKVTSNPYDENMKYSLFMYKGLIVSIPHNEKLPDVRITTAEDAATEIHYTDTVQHAIEWIDAYVEVDPLRQGRELSLCQFQGMGGEWKPFLHEQHYVDTKADGSWPIRYLSVD